MAAPRGASWAALLLAAGALTLAAAVSEPTTVPFDVRPGGVVHSFSQDVGPGVSAETAGAGRSRARERVAAETRSGGRGCAKTDSSGGRGRQLVAHFPCPSHSKEGMLSEQSGGSPHTALCRSREG